MNARKPDSTGPLDDRQLDRLVDGELNREAYRDLLAALEQAPDGWRRCALAFLEAQAWAQEFGQIRRDQRLTLPPAGPSTAADRRRPGWGGWRPVQLLALAASALLAFTLGTAAPRWIAWRTQEARPGGNQNAGLMATSGEPAAGATRYEALRPVGNVRLVVDGPGGEAVPATEVPVYEAPAGLDPWLAGDRPGLEPDLVQLLREVGHDVVGQRQWIPGQLEDGRPVIVPVERYEITPVRHRAY
jgi:hypothetical protein